MKVITTGHKYELANFEGCGVQTLQFIEKIRKSPDSAELITVNDGTTNEEVLAMLIDRMNHLNEKFPSFHNVQAIVNLKQALFWLNDRTSERKLRGVEGYAAP